MNLKPTISNISQKNIADFLGESTDKVSQGLDLSLDSFLAIIKTFVQKPTGATELLQILNQGGHTGDVVQNLNDLTQKPEKIQLLIKIGSNIVQHFAGSDLGGLIDTVSSKSGAKKTSVNSLLNLAGPLVLGQIGKLKNDENLDENGIKNMFSAVADTTNFTPAPIFDTRPAAETVASQPTNTTKTPIKNTGTTKSTPWKYIIPWVILGIVTLFPLLKNNVDFKKVFSFKNPVPAIKDTLSKVPSPADFLPEKAPSEIDNENQKVADDGFGTPTETKTEPTVEKTIEPELKNLEAKEKKAEKTPEKVAFKPEKKAAEKPKEGKIEKPKEAKKEVSLPKPEQAPKETKKIAKAEKNSDEPETSSSLPAGWKSVPSSIFGRNNAEIKNGSILNQYTDKTIVVSPTNNSSLAEDRAYAIKEYLLEKGNQNVSVGKRVIGNSGSLIAIDIKN
jgi:outer membrane protein OmpA-like peptidoglycan-associated protein